MKNKFLSVLLVFCMVLTLMPMTALADFADTEGHWGKDAIDRWAAEGVLNGKGDDVFDPNGNMTRAEFAQMLCNLMGYTKKAPNTFTDVADDAWYADAILKLVEAGVLNGVGNNMAAPNAPITREQAAVMLCRAFDLKTSSASMSYSDAGAVSGWAAGAVAALTEKGMMNGVGNNQIAPQLNINRASVATLINNMVAEYVTEDKVITGEVNGIIVVAGDAKVTFEDATVNAPVIVAPSAEGAEVELTGTTTAENVVVAAEKAAVTVGKDASAESVTAAADKAEVKVEGKVDTVAVTGEDANVAVSGTAGNVAVAGEGAKVDVSGSVGTVSTEAANTTVAVSGTVSNVEVAEGADKTEITAASGAKIDSVTTSAEDVKVSGSGEVGSVTADAGSVDVTTKGTEVKNEGADNVTAGGKDVAEGETATSDSSTPSSGSSGDSGSSKPKNEAGVIKAPLADHSDDPVTGSLGTLVVSSTAAEGDNTYNVTIKGTNIVKHKNAGDGAKADYWVGFAVPYANAPDDADETSYTFWYDGGQLNSATDRYIKSGSKFYTTIYFDSTDQAASDKDVVVKNGSNEVVATYHMSFEVTYACTVTFEVEGQENVVKTASGGKVDYVATPETTSTTYYTGNWVEKDGTDLYKPQNNKLSVSKDVTLIPDKATIEEATSHLAERPDGPAGEVESFNYASAYTSAGISRSGSTITLNVGTMDAYVKNASNATSKAYLEQTVGGAAYVYYGIKIAKPSGATNVTELASNLSTVKTDTLSLATDSTDGSGSDVLGGELIKYFPMGKDKGEQGFEPIAEESVTTAWDRYYVWTDDNGALKAVYHLQLGLTITPAPEATND